MTRITNVNQGSHPSQRTCFFFFFRQLPGFKFSSSSNLYKIKVLANLKTLPEVPTQLSMALHSSYCLSYNTIAHVPSLLGCGLHPEMHLEVKLVDSCHSFAAMPRSLTRWTFSISWKPWMTGWLKSLRWLNQTW